VNPAEEARCLRPCWGRVRGVDTISRLRGDEVLGHRCGESVGSWSAAVWN